MPPLNRRTVRPNNSCLHALSLPRRNLPAQSEPADPGRFKLSVILPQHFGLPRPSPLVLRQRMELLPEFVRVEASRRLLESGLPLPNTNASVTAKTAAHRGAAALRRKVAAATGPSSRLPGTPVRTPSTKVARKDEQKRLRDVKCEDAPLAPVGVRGGHLVQDVPVVLAKLVECLTPHVKAEGLFRRSGSMARQRKMRDTLWKSLVVLEVEAHYVHDVANVLKQIIRESLEPLLPTDFQKKTVNALSDPKQGLEAMFLYLCLLPPRHASSLVYLVHFLAFVASHAESNRMDASNLAIVFAPILFPGCSVATQRLELQNCKQVAQTLIENVDKVCELPLRLNELALAEFGLGHTSSESDLLTAPSQRKRKHAKTKQRRRSGSLSRVLNATVKGIQKARASFLTAPVDDGHEFCNSSVDESKSSKNFRKSMRSKTDLTYEDLNWLRRSEALISIRGPRRQPQELSENALVKSKGRNMVSAEESGAWGIRTPEINVEVDKDFLKSVDLKTPDSKKMRRREMMKDSSPNTRKESQLLPKSTPINKEDIKRTQTTSSLESSMEGVTFTDFVDASATKQCKTRSAQSTTDLTTRLSAWQEAREAKRETRAGKSASSLHYLLRDVPRRVHSIRAVKAAKSNNTGVTQRPETVQLLDPGRVRRQSSAFELIGDQNDIMPSITLRSRRSMGVPLAPKLNQDDNLEQLGQNSEFPATLAQTDDVVSNEVWKSADEFFSKTPSFDLALRADQPNSRRSSVQKLLKENKGQVLKSIETFSKFSMSQSKK